MTLQRKSDAYIQAVGLELCETPFDQRPDRTDAICAPDFLPCALLRALYRTPSMVNILDYRIRITQKKRAKME